MAGVDSVVFGTLPLRLCLVRLDNGEIASLLGVLHVED